MPSRVFVLNGPNLNLLGRREPQLYGTTTLAEIEEMCTRVAHELDFDVFFAQSNQEGQLIDWVHQAKDEAAGVVINPAGLSFRSVPLMDALKILDVPVVEVHITNIFRREPIYHQSITAFASWGFMAGLGASVYELALRGLADKLGSS